MVHIKHLEGKVDRVFFAVSDTLLPCTVAVKKTLPFSLPSVLFVRLQNGAQTDCKRSLGQSIPFHFLQ